MTWEVYIDDHLRNHGFLIRQLGRWSLSPAYDLNPVPEIDRVRTSKTPIQAPLESDRLTWGKCRQARQDVQETTCGVSCHRREGKSHKVELAR